MARDPWQFDPARFKEANRDYLDRVDKEGVNAAYDATLDTLFIEIGGPQEALSEHLLDNILFRVEPDSLRVVGFEILDFLDDFLPNNRLFREAFSDWKLSRDSDSELTLMEPQYAPIRDVVEVLLGQLAHRAASLT